MNEHTNEPMLVNAAQKGDAQAFQVLVLRYYGMVWTIGFARLRQREAAEELAQEVFLRVFLHLAKLDHPEYFSTWLSRIARNLAETWRKANQTRSRFLTLVPLGETESEMPDTTGALVLGKVLKPDGAPAARATVSVLSRKYRDRPTALTTSDDSGHFTVRLPPGSYSLYAKLGSLVAKDFDALRIGEDGMPDRQPEIRLQQGGSVRGQAVDKSTGKPVPDAMVVTDSGDFVRTDADGKFAIAGFTRGAHSICAFKQRLFRPVVLFDTTAQPDADVLLEMKPGGIVRGTVTDEQGKPIARAAISGHGCGATYICGTQCTTTDAEGRFALHGYDVDRPVSTVYVEAAGYAQASRGGLSFATGQNELQANFRLGRKDIVVKTASDAAQVKKLRRIEGKVSDAEDRPVSGALVAYGFAAAYPGYATAKTDENGHYVLRGVETADDVISVQRQGFAPAFACSGTSEAAATMNFRLEPQHTLAGKIVDEQGEPVKGMSIAVMARTSNRSRPEFRYLSVRATSGQSGEFTLDSLPAGKVFVDVYGGNYSEVRDKPLEVDRTDHVITLAAPGQLSGTVVDAESGSPVPRFTVRLAFPRQKMPEDVPGVSLPAAYLSDGVSFNSPDGTFTISGLGSELRPGTAMRAEVDVPGCSVCAIDRVICEPLRSVNPAANVFRVSPSTKLEGEVTMSSGQTSAPLAGARLTLLDTSACPVERAYVLRNDLSDYHPLFARTDANGRFRFDSMPFAKAALVAEKAGFGRVILPDLTTSRSVHITLQPAATLQGNRGTPMNGLEKRDL